MIVAEINNDLKKQFEEEGFLILPQFLDTTKITNIANKFEDLFSGMFETGIEPDEWNWRKGRDPNNVTRQICNGWKSDLDIKKIVTMNYWKSLCRINELVRFRLLQDNVLWKPPGGKTLAYHQDAAYDDWVIPQTMMTCWMPLDDVSQEKGTLEYVKGSHKWG